jgi:hypothetical protein
VSPSSLSVTYYDPEAEPVPEPEPTPEPKKRRGRPPGSVSKPKPQAKPKRSIPWFNISRSMFWVATFVFVLVALFIGVKLWLGIAAAHIILAVSTLGLSVLLDRGWRKMRT